MGGLTLRILLRSKWLLHLPDLEVFQWEKIFFSQNAYFCLKMIFRPCYFSALFFKPSLRQIIFDIRL